LLAVYQLPFGNCQTISSSELCRSRVLRANLITLRTSST